MTYISINGILRDWWTKLIYEYRKFYLETDSENEEDFPYEIRDVVTSNVMEKLAFQSEDEMKYFLCIDFPLEIYGQAAPMYKNVNLDLMRYIEQNKEVCLVSKEFAKSIPATLFFLSKTSCVCDNIKFYHNDDDIEQMWQQCDTWITDDPKILLAKPADKTSIKVIKDYNKDIPCDKEITNLAQLVHHELEKTIDQ